MKEKAFEMVEKKEFLFEEGAERIIAKTKSLLLSKDCAVISISGRFGDDTNAGKTTLASRVAIELQEQGIPVITSDEMKGLERCYSESVIKTLKKNKGSKKIAIILGAEGTLAIPKEMRSEVRAMRNRSLQEVGGSVGLSLPKVDMYVLIYRPDKLPSEDEREFADLVIRNEDAVDKNRF